VDLGVAPGELEVRHAAAPAREPARPGQVDDLAGARDRRDAADRDVLDVPDHRDPEPRLCHGASAAERATARARRLAAREPQGHSMKPHGVPVVDVVFAAPMWTWSGSKDEVVVVVVVVVEVEVEVEVEGRGRRSRSKVEVEGRGRRSRSRSRSKAEVEGRRSWTWTWTAVRAARAAYSIVRRARRGNDEEAAAGAGPCAGSGSA
jgi:hypothetical protein